MEAALIALIAALIPLITAAAAWFAKQQKNQNTQLKDNRDRLGDIHVLVNGRLSLALERIKTLEDRLGIEHTDL